MSQEEFYNQVYQQQETEDMVYNENLKGWIVPKQPKQKPKNIYIRVAGDYYKKVTLVDMNGNPFQDTIPIKRQTIVDDFGAKTLKKIKKYDTMCVVPSYLNFKQVVYGAYNWFKPFEHKLIQGEYETSLKLIKHIFGDQYEMGLDYIQLLFQKPTQILPVLCLVSEENQTGKTTFINFLNFIFGANMEIVSTSDIEGGFNTHFITKHIIAIDESDLNKQHTTGTIKQMATQKTAIRKGKFQNETKVDFFGKLIILSNNERSFINVKDKDIRYWIRKVPVIKEHDFDIETKLKKEIPAFMHFINNRPLSYPKAKSRAWFDEKDFITKWAVDAKNENRTELYFDLFEKLENFMQVNKYESVTWRIMDIIKIFYAKDNRYSNKYISKVLRDEFGIIFKKERNVIPGEEYSGKIYGNWYKITKNELQLNKDDIQQTIDIQ